MNMVQQRINELEAMRKRLAASQPEDGSWDWFLDKEIEELSLTAPEEMTNARRAGRTPRLRTRLKSLVLLIVSPVGEKRKGETV